MDIADGYLVVVKQDCPTCVEIIPALKELVAGGVQLAIASQDDADFPPGVPVIDDRDLELSWRLEVEVTPTLFKIAGGQELERIVGWDRTKWQTFMGTAITSSEVPEWRPGCGSLTQLPDIAARLAARIDGLPAFGSRRVALGKSEDEHEAMFARGWTDGLPVVPPTVERVTAMLGGTARDPAELVGILAPDYARCTVEKVAVNAVMAGCRPDYLPIVLAAVEAVASEQFNLHGVAATTWYSGPIVVVNGPIAARVGMNSSFNAFGPGNRANATIGRALNLIIRNIGGSRPGGVDRSTQGHPVKYTMAFAEREDESPWPSLATERGVAADRSAVTVFAGQGPSPVSDQTSRTAESLAGSFASSLRVVHHARAMQNIAVLLAVSPEHAKVFAKAGWSKDDLRRHIVSNLTIPAAELGFGYLGIDVGFRDAPPTDPIAKFEAQDLSFVHVGSPAGGNTGVFSGWVTGARGSQMTTVPIEEH